MTCVTKPHTHNIGICHELAQKAEEDPRLVLTGTDAERVGGKMSQ